MMTSVLFTLFTYVSLATASRLRCGLGTYLHQDEMRCVPCTVCSADTITLRQCYDNLDTVCGKWKFEFRSAGKQQEELQEVTSSSPSQNLQQTSSTVVVAGEMGDKWFTITMVLIGVLVITCVVGVILLFVTCFYCRHKQREIICDPVYTSALLRDDLQTPPKFEPFKIVTET